MEERRAVERVRSKRKRRPGAEGYEDFMVITFMGRTRIPYSEIENVEYKRQFFSKGIQIKYRNQGSTSITTVFARHPGKILEILGSKVKKSDTGGC